MMGDNVLFAFGLTVFAGLATGVGSIIAFVAKRNNPAFLAGSLGFSAGVMIYVSFMEILPKAQEALSINNYGQWPQVYTVLAFFAGIALIALIDKLVPSFENPHEIREPLYQECLDAQNGCTDEDHQRAHDKKNKNLMRMGFFSALAIAIHNFPEGLATFMAGLQDPAIGISIAIAIAIHNIPEGIAVSVPIFHATGSKRKAFILSFMSGLAEPLGALVGYFLLRQFFSDEVFGFVFASVAGIMVYISLDELLPTAEKYGKHHIAIWGLIAGMAVMAISLLLLA
jgi:zinc transporter, ZIP family